jgi:thiosulfate dehydrogenase
MKKILTVAVCSALSISSLFASEVVKFDKKLIQERNNIGYKYEGEKLEYKIPDETITI